MNVSTAPCVTDSVRSTDSAIRWPIQKRSRERFEAILDAAERLLLEHEPVEIGVHRLAAEVGISAASIYHFFPDPPLVFVALAKRYLRFFEDHAEDELPTLSFAGWQELQTYEFRAARAFFNANTPARKVLLGTANSFDVRQQDLQSDVVVAQRGIAQMNRLFVMPEIPDLLDRSIEVIVISDALWALSIHRYGTITEDMEEQARRARIAYSRTYLPEYLPRRSKHDPWA